MRKSLLIIQQYWDNWIVFWKKIRLESQFILCIITNSIWIKGKGVKVLEKLLLTKAAEYQ